MEPTTVIEEVTEVLKEIDERQVSLVLCLIDGATSVLLLNVLWYKVWVTVDGCYWPQVCPCEIQWWSVCYSAWINQVVQGEVLIPCCWYFWLPLKYPGVDYGVLIASSASLSARTTATLRQVQCFESSSELFWFNGFQVPWFRGYQEFWWTSQILEPQYSILIPHNWFLRR